MWRQRNGSVICARKYTTCVSLCGSYLWVLLFLGGPGRRRHRSGWGGGREADDGVLLCSSRFNSLLREDETKTASLSHRREHSLYFHYFYFLFFIEERSRGLHTASFNNTDQCDTAPSFKDPRVEQASRLQWEPISCKHGTFRGCGSKTRADDALHAALQRWLIINSNILTTPKQAVSVQLPDAPAGEQVRFLWSPLSGKQRRDLTVTAAEFKRAGRIHE